MLIDKYSDENMIKESQNFLFGDENGKHGTTVQQLIQMINNFILKDKHIQVIENENQKIEHYDDDLDNIIIFLKD